MTSFTLGLAVESSDVPRAVADLDKLVPAAQRVEAATDKMSAKAKASFGATSEAARQAANDFGAQVARFQTMADQINRALGVGRTSFGRGDDIAAYGRELDAMRAKFNPIFSAVQQYKTLQSDIRAAHRMGAISSAEMTAAMDRERRSTLASIDAIKGRNQAMRGGGMRGNFGGGAGMIAQQFFDVGITAQMGQSLGMIGLQQGSQLGFALEQSLGTKGGKGALGAVKALGTGLMGLVSPMNLVGIGAAVAGAAVVQWFTKGADEAKTLDERMKAHRDTVASLNEAYRGTGRAAIEFGKESLAALESAKRIARKAAEEKNREETRKLFQGGGLGGAATSNSTATPIGFNILQWGLNKFGPENSFAVAKQFKPFEDAIVKLRDGAVAGKAGWQEFYDAINAKVQIDPSLQTAADQLREVTKRAFAAAEQIEAVKKQLGTPNGFITSQDPRNGMGDLSLYQSRERIAAERSRASFDAEMQAIRARTDQERISAARAQAATVYNDSEGPSVRRARIDMAAQAEAARIERERVDAADQRRTAMQQSLAQQQLELDLIGKTTGEAAALRYEFERMQELREQARRTNDFIDPKEVDAIEAAAQAMKEYADAATRAKLQQDLAFERQQMGRSAEEQAIASRLRGTGLGMDSGMAQELRRQQALEREVELWSDIRQAGIDAYSDIFDLAFDGFDNWEDRLGDIAKNMAKNIFDMGVKNPFINEQYGTDLPTLDKAGGIGGFFATMFGMTPNPALGQSTASMQVTAAVVNIGGAGIAGLAGLPGAGELPEMAGRAGMGLPEMAGGWGSNASRMFSPANSNIGSTIDFARATSGAAAYRDAIASIESAGSGNYGALGPVNARMGQALGRYQIMEANLPEWSKAALGRNVGRAEFMGSPGIQDAIFDHRFGGYVDRFGQRGAAQAWFGGPGSVGKLGRQDALGTSVGGYGDKFMAALERMSPQTDSASQALQKLATTTPDVTSGFGDLSKNLLNIFPSAPSGNLNIQMPEMAGKGGMMGGGLLQWLMSLFGFADGTENAPAGWAWVGERGPELMRMRGGETIRSNPRSRQMMEQAGGGVTVHNSTHIHNNAGVQVREETTDDGNGGRRTDIFIERMVGKAISRKGGAANQAMGAMGLNTMGPRVRRS